MSLEEPSPKLKTVVFVHPDLGIGGAERLVVDAAVGLQQQGHRVVIFTSHCDPSHCFDEARDGTLDVRVRGNTVVPPTIFGRFAILCAIARQVHLLLSIAVLSSELWDLTPKDLFVDQLSAGLPLLWWLTRGYKTNEVRVRAKNTKTGREEEHKIACRPTLFFYCHFPDLLLARGRESLIKRLYRLPFDTLEEWSMGYADVVAVNSSFTKGIVAQTWPALARQKELRVVYPCVDTSPASATPEKWVKEEPPAPLWKDKTVFLSINRFERKKDIALAVRSFAKYLSQKAISATSKTPRLVVAGGYDARITENVSYHRELQKLCDSLSLKHATTGELPTALALPADVDVVFMPSIAAGAKDALLKGAAVLLYTPQNEHFGIVPLEAMLTGTPVLAAASGGPLETVREGETGWLRDAEDVVAWAETLGRVGELADTEKGKEELECMGRRGQEWVVSRFGRDQMCMDVRTALDGFWARAMGEKFRNRDERLLRGGAAESWVRIEYLLPLAPLVVGALGVGLKLALDAWTGP